MSIREQASFSVILPTYDRPAGLERCLESLAALTFPRDCYDVIVIDDGGSVDAAQIAARYSTRMSVCFVRIDHLGPASARNSGIARSRAANLAFIDDDCVAHPTWLNTMAARLDAHAGAVIGGQVRNELEVNRYSRASQELQHFLYRWYHDELRGDLRFFTTNNLAIARRDFDRVGYFDSSFPFASEDRDWCDRAMFSGVDLIYAPEAIVIHSHDLTLRTFLRQHYRYGKGAARFHATRAKRRGIHIRLEPFAFYRSMLTAPFSARSADPVRESLLLLASQSASFFGFVREMTGGMMPGLMAGSERQPARNSHPASSPQIDPVTGVISRN